MEYDLRINIVIIYYTIPYIENFGFIRINDLFDFLITTFIVLLPTNVVITLNSFSSNGMAS